MHIGYVWVFYVPASLHVIVWCSKKHLTQSERYLPPGDDLISDEKVQAKFCADRKRDRIRRMKIKQDKIIDDRRWQLTLFLSKFVDTLNLDIFSL